MKPSVFIEQIPVGDYKNFSYIVADPSTREAAVFDPAWDIPKLLEILEKNNFRLLYVVNTHAHMDHIQGNPEVAKTTGARIVMSERSLARKDLGMMDGEEIKLGSVILRFIHTPGHSPESMCVLVGNRAIITGDTLFIGECGRVDLPGGSADQLFESFEKLRSLDPAVIVYPGHDYGPKPSSTLGEQFETNYALANRTRAEFIRFMNQP